jgi:hypothetical protein
MHWRCVAPALQMPEFKPQSHQKKKEKCEFKQIISSIISVMFPTLLNHTSGQVM